MRVAVIHSFYQSDSPSGENQAVLAQVSALQAAGHIVRLISRYSDNSSTGGLPYIASRAWYVATGHGASAQKEISDFRPDVVHIHNLFPNWGYRWVGKINAPVVSSIHNFRPICASGTLYREGAKCTLCPSSTSIHSLTNRCYRGSAIATLPLAIATREAFPRQYLPRHTDHVVFLSEHQRQTYEDLSGFFGPSTVIPNFVPDVGRFDFAEKSSKGWCYIGRISEEKGVFDLARSWPAGVPLDIYGDGPGVDALRPLLTEDMVYRGSVPNNEVHKVLVRHKGLVFPSKVAEIAPLTYLESLRAGRPVVAFSANAAARDILTNRGRGGEVFSDWHDLPSALLRADHNPEARSEARDVYEKKFSPASWLSAMDDLYRAVVDARGREN